MDDDRDVTRTQQGDDIDLFEEDNGSHSGANGSHRQSGDSGDASCGPGQSNGLKLKFSRLNIFPSCRKVDNPFSFPVRR